MLGTVERNNRQFDDEDIYVARTDIRVPRFRSNIVDDDGTVVALGNMDQMAREIKKRLSVESGFRELLSDVRQGKKSAVFYGVAGAIVIFTAAVGFEFGLRDGQDLKLLPKILNNAIQKRKRK